MLRSVNVPATTAVDRTVRTPHCSTSDPAAGTIDAAPDFIGAIDLDRRNWLKISTASASYPVGGVFTLPRRLRIRFLPITDAERRCISRIVDLLVPRDEAPGAIDLGVDREVTSAIETNRYDSQWVAEGILWLDERARALAAHDFLALDGELQRHLLREMESAPGRSAPERAFILLRSATMTAYYARAAAWPSLGYYGPPQPAGFPDFAAPPRPRT